MRLTSLAALAAAAFLIAAPAQAQMKKSITLGTEGAYAPWNMTDASGKIVGFEIDLAADICARMKVECKFVAQDWDGMIPALNAGKFDGILAGMSITEEREKQIAFTDAYANGPNGLETTKSSPLAKLPGAGTVINISKDPEGAQKAIDAMKPLLKGKTIGVQSSTTNANFVEKYFKGVVEMREYKTVEQHDLDLQAGRVDANFLNRRTAADLAKPEYKDLAQVGTYFVGGVLGRGVGVGLRKADTELKEAFNVAIKASIADGVVKKLSEKYFGFDLTPK